ncbi:MAG: hypothetical protein LUF87_09440 [Alistipes sp.]|nr:hypothetical protein [Alistipes sp.]
MKEVKKFLLMLFIAAIPVGMMTACSDDDDDDLDDGDDTVELILADEAKGAYKGTFNVTNQSGLTGDITVTMVKAGDDVVKIQIGEISMLAGYFVANFDEPTDIKLTGETGDIIIASQTQKIGMSVSAIGDFEAEVTISGTIEDAEYLTLTATVSADDLGSWGYNPMEIAVVAEKE